MPSEWRYMDRNRTLSSLLIILDRCSLAKDGRAEAIAFLRNQLPHTRRLGPDHEKTLMLRMLYAKALAYIYDDVQMPPPTRDDCREAINILTDVLGRARRVLGPSHPITTRAEIWLRTTRLAARVLRDDSDDSDDVPLATLARRKK